MSDTRIGVDTGGTFTDFVIYSRGVLAIKKILSTPKDPSQAIVEGVKENLAAAAQALVIHGTTVATNSLLERKGGRIGLITTKGFEDVLFIGRQVRKLLYSLEGEERHPLIPPDNCFGIEERTSAVGNVERKVASAELHSVIRRIKGKRLEAVAVSLINSFANPLNEKIIRRGLEKQGILFSVSSDILPEHREYERTTVAVINAYLMPVMSRYLQSLERTLQNVTLRVMQSNEGYISPETAKTEPIRTALSGPAGGVVGSYHLGKQIGVSKLISFDMGGTSSDVSLIDGEIHRTNESTIGDFPVRLPIIDIHTVGAGGGSIAHVDRGGSLRVGPSSAGADPGPACYGKGNLPTVSDAHVVLGRLVPEFFLGGRMRIYPERSLKAIENLALQIDKSPLETAYGIIQIANANMEKAIRVISIERGFDPRDFALFSFGGAGGMHAVEIAANLRIAKVIVPQNAGVLSAFGLLMADSIKDYSKSLLIEIENISKKELDNHLLELHLRGVEEMKNEGFKEAAVRTYPYLDLRYLGQSYEITIPYRIRGKDLSSLVSAFHRAHRRLYSYHQPERAVEIVNIRTKAVGKAKKIKLAEQPFKDSNPGLAFMKNQPLFFGWEKFETPVFIRERLHPGNEVSGPALVVDRESTTFLPPGYRLEVDGLMNLIIEKK
jgi:N-methylhydantoinase A/oxoprolinase/acetone carboxylase beta subunit